MAMKIYRDKHQGEDVVLMENDYYKTILAWTKARLPLSYVFKSTSNEEFLMPVSLKKKTNDFEFYGGIIDSIPWVSGPGVPDKGALWSSKWKTSIKNGKNEAQFIGKTSFSYNDPLTKEKCRLSFEKTITGYDKSSRLKMNYKIKNIGKNKAKFMFSAHSRTAIGGKCDNGDYFFAPGKKCHVYYGTNICKKNIKPPCWAPWPLEQARHFRKSDEERNIFVFLPSNWSCVGDEKFRETLFFVSSPIMVGKKKEKMKMGIYMTNERYVMEPCLTYRIGTKSWGEKEATVVLKPEEICSFQLDMIAYHGVAEKDIVKLKESDASSAYIVLKRPSIKKKDDYIQIKGKIAIPGEYLLRLIAREDKRKDIYSSCKVGPGIVNLDKRVKCNGNPSKVRIELEDSSGTITISQMDFKSR